jgi:hypothetical protein
VFRQDVPNSLTADLLDTEFSQLANDTRQSEASNFSDLQHQLAQFLRLALAALGILGLRPAFLICADPAIKRDRLDDADQFFNCAANVVGFVKNSRVLDTPQRSRPISSLPSEYLNDWRFTMPLQ